MTGLNGGPDADHLRAASTRRWLAANGSPGFWFLASGVFAGNGLFAAWQHYWWLAVMQMLTATLALRAAFAAGAPDRARRAVTSETDPEAPPPG